MKILFLEIETKTDILALAAFLISISTILSQAFFFFKGPRIELERPNAVIFTKYRNTDGNVYLRAISRMTIINKGYPGYDDIVKRETITISMEEKKLRLHWFSIGRTNNDKDAAILEVKEESDAAPIKVQAKNLVSHESFFYPFPTESTTGLRYDNFITWDDFKKQIVKSKKLKIEFACETYFHKTKRKVGYVCVNDNEIKFLLKNEWLNCRVNDNACYEF